MCSRLVCGVDIMPGSTPWSNVNSSGVAAPHHGVCSLGVSHLANIGDTRSLILHPASTTHRQLTQEQRDACGVGDDVIRLSIGLESVDDLLSDLDAALALNHP